MCQKDSGRMAERRGVRKDGVWNCADHTFPSSKLLVLGIYTYTFVTEAYKSPAGKQQAST